MIKDLKKIYQIYSRELKQIYKKEKNESIRNTKVSEVKVNLEALLSKLESLLFASSVSGNKQYLDKLDNGTSKSIKLLSKEAIKIPQALVYHLIPEDKEIISTLSTGKTKTPNELAVRYCEILFAQLDHSIGSETFRRTAQFKLPRLPEIEISDDEISLFKSKIRSSQRTSMRNPTLDPNVIVPERIK